MLYQVFPLVLMLASLVTFLRLARTSELVVMRAAGVSALRLIARPGGRRRSCSAAVFVAVVNPFVAASIKRGLALEDDFRNAGRSLLSFSPEGVWLRQADPEGQTVIQAARTNANGTILSRVRMHRFDARARSTPASRRRPPGSMPGAWVLEQAIEWRARRRRTASTAPRSRSASTCRPTLTAEQILDSFSPPETVGFWQLGRFIAQMEESGFSGQRHRLFLQSELAKPDALRRDGADRRRLRAAPAPASGRPG